MFQQLKLTHLDHSSEALELSYKNWTSPASFLKGRCYQILSEKVKAFELFNFKDLFIYTHTPKCWNEENELLEMFFSKESTERYLVKIELFKMLDYIGKPCNQDPAYDFDRCITQAMDDASLHQFGCTSPLGDMLDKICKNEPVGQQLIGLINGARDRWKANCLHPCTYLKMSIEKGPSNDCKPFCPSGIYFADVVTVIESQYSYDGLSLLAEIGGYVGLFLGVSILQLAEMVKYLAAKLNDWLVVT